MSFTAYDFEVCSNCLIVAVNGDDSGVEEGDPEPLHKLPEGLRYAAPGSEEDTDLGFRHTTCEGCGALPGDRYALIGMTR